MSNVFIIINEWTEDDRDYEVIHGNQFWLSEAGALVKLAEMASNLGIEVPYGHTSFDLPEELLAGLERDTYYIRELTRR